VATTQEATPKAQKQDRRKSSIATTKKAKKAKEDTTPQKELVNTVSELRNTYRQTVVGFLITCISEHAKRLINDKKITLQQDSTVETLCENRALQIEHHVYLNHFAEGQIVTDYKNKMRTIALNLKSNAALSDEILGGRLSCERLSHMTTEEMASKELKELTQQVRLESEKHNTLINETGPRIRRTHKGEELVNEETTVQSGQDTLLESGTVIRRSSEVVMDEPPPPPPPPAPITPGQPDSPAQPAEASMSPPTTVTATSETPRSPSQALPIEGSAPPLEKKERSFSIENVWSQVESPDTERRPSRLPARPAPVKPVDSKIDKDIDMLLKDDDQDVGTPPYSPASYNDHYSPKPDQDDDTVWRGRIDMNQIANLTATASLLGGPEQLGDKRWFELLDPVLNIDGRIKHERATEYLCGQKFSRSSSMVLASLKPEHSANQAQFDKLFEYFKTKERYAVVGKHNSPCIKDLYIVPIDSNETLPDWFNVVDPPSKVPEKSRSSRMLVLIFVVIRSLVSGHVENGNGIGARRFSAQPTLEFSTPQQPQASPYAPQHMPQQQQYQASPLSNQPPQQQPYSPSPLSQPPPQQAHYGSTVPYGYPQQQQHPHPLPSLQAPQQFSPPPQQHPHPPAPLPVPHGYPQHQQSPPPSQQQQQQQQHHSPQPHHQSPRQLPQPLPTQPPLQQEQRPPQRMAFVPKHAMTQELIGLIPKLSEVQAMAIDKLLQEHPELQTKPDVLAKEVEKVLGSVGSGV